MMIKDRVCKDLDVATVAVCFVMEVGHVGERPQSSVVHITQLNNNAHKHLTTWQVILELFAKALARYLSYCNAVIFNVT